MGREIICSSQHPRLIVGKSSHLSLRGISIDRGCVSCNLYTLHNVTRSEREVAVRVIDGLMPSFLEQHKNGYLSF